MINGVVELVVAIVILLIEGLIPVSKLLEKLSKGVKEKQKEADEKFAKSRQKSALIVSGPSTSTILRYYQQTLPQQLNKLGKDLKKNKIETERIFEKWHEFSLHYTYAVIVVIFTLLFVFTLELLLWRLSFLSLDFLSLHMIWSISIIFVLFNACLFYILSKIYILYWNSKEAWQELKRIDLKMQRII